MPRPFPHTRAAHAAQTTAAAGRKSADSTRGIRGAEARSRRCSARLSQRPSTPARRTGTSPTPERRRHETSSPMRRSTAESRRIRSARRSGAAGRRSRGPGADDRPASTRRSVHRAACSAASTVCPSVPSNTPDIARYAAQQHERGRPRTAHARDIALLRRARSLNYIG